MVSGELTDAFHRPKTTTYVFKTAQTISTDLDTACFSQTFAEEKFIPNIA